MNKTKLREAACAYQIFAKNIAASARYKFAAGYLRGAAELQSVAANDARVARARLFQLLAS